MSEFEEREMKAEGVGIGVEEQSLADDPSQLDQEEDLDDKDETVPESLPIAPIPALELKSNQNAKPVIAAVPRLDDLVIKALAENYDSEWHFLRVSKLLPFRCAVYPALDRIPTEYLDNVVALLDPQQVA